MLTFYLNEKGLQVTREDELVISHSTYVFTSGNVESGIYLRQLEQKGYQINHRAQKATLSDGDKELKIHFRRAPGLCRYDYGGCFAACLQFTQDALSSLSAVDLAFLMSRIRDKIE